MENKSKIILAVLCAAKFTFAGGTTGINHLPFESKIQLKQPATMQASDWFTVLPYGIIDKKSKPAKEANCTTENCDPVIQCALLHNSYPGPQEIPTSKEFFVKGYELRSGTDNDLKPLYHPWKALSETAFLHGREINDIYMETAGGSRVALECMMMQRWKSFDGIKFHWKAANGIGFITVDDLRTVVSVVEAIGEELP